MSTAPFAAFRSESAAPSNLKTPALHWIDGEWIDSENYQDSINPATSEVIGNYANGGALEADKAINAAVRAFKESDWKENRRLRSKVLNAMADRFEARREDLIQILALENGKIVSEAAFEVDMVPSKLRYWAAMVLTETGSAGEVFPGRLSVVTRSPIGVAGIVAPFNSPVILTIRSLAPALAAGTTTVIKLPGLTAQINRLFAEVISETPGLPRGVVNIFSELHGGGARFMMASPALPVISYTGSTKTGRAISAMGAPMLKKFGLELGGKTPMIVFDDADIETAVPVIVKALTTFAGQFCMTGSRLLVDSGIANRFRQVIADRLEKVKVGPASDPSSEMGPVINRANVERIDKMVEDAIAAGANVLVRGGPVTEGPLSKGAFYRPTLLEVTDNKLPIVQQEVFGPVLVMQVFETEAEAIDLANDNEYGLSASIWTRDVDRPYRVARKLNSGTIWINDWAVVYDEFEEGGFNQSGVGRLNGKSAIDDFLEYKHIAFNSGTSNPGEK